MTRGASGGQAADAVEGGGLAGAVGADQGDDLPLAHMEADAVQRLDVAVFDLEIFDFEEHQIVSSPR